MFDFTVKSRVARLFNR